MSFPHGTLAVNLVGCLIIGLLSQLVEARNIFTPEARLFIFIGILGAFTTFSTFSNETMNLLRGGNSILAFANVAVHVGMGLSMVWLGQMLARFI